MDTQPLRPSLLDLPISFFEYDQLNNRYANVPAQTTTLRRMASTKFYRDTIEAIRAETNPIRQKELKTPLSAFTPVALLRHRKRDTTFAEKISQQWPLLMGDIDQKDNPDIDMVELKRHMARLPYVLLCAYSVRGGLWFVVRLPDNQSPDSLAAHFRYLQKLFTEKLEIKLDATKGGNPTDLRYVSYDVSPYINENAGVMSGTYTPPAPRTKASTFDYKSTGSQDEGNLLRRIVEKAERATDGQRHLELRNAAILAGGYVAGGQLDEQTAIYALETVASEWPMFSKSQKTIRDGIHYGQAKPINPEVKNDQVTYQQEHSKQGKSMVPTAKGYIRGLAVGTIEIRQKSVGTIADQLANPGSILKLDESQIERLTVEPADVYPAEWDRPNPPDAQPIISAKSFFDWQRQHKHFGQMGLNSLESYQPT